MATRRGYGRHRRGGVAPPAKFAPYTAARSALARALRVLATLKMTAERAFGKRATARVAPTNTPKPSQTTVGEGLAPPEKSKVCTAYRREKRTVGVAKRHEGIELQSSGL